MNIKFVDLVKSINSLLPVLGNEAKHVGNKIY